MTRYASLHQKIEKWSVQHGRQSLPWRQTHHPYHIYVSEIMLQQTQVKTVLTRFYAPFLEKFPTLTALANAELESVLKAWEGMGYYSRAKNLHRTAQLAAPELPRSSAELQKLPGIGKNTAHAILAFAHHQPVPLLESNIKRLLSRFFGQEHPTEKMLWKSSYELLNAKDPFTHNQAMMDLGALVCTPKKPKCGECPLFTECKGKLEPERYPKRSKNAPKPIRTHALIVQSDPSHQTLYLLQRTERFLHGLYGFPHYVLKKPGIKKIGQLIYHYTHFSHHADIYHQTVSETQSQIASNGGWYPVDALHRLPLSGIDQKVLQLFLELSPSLLSVESYHHATEIDGCSLV